MKTKTMKSIFACCIIFFACLYANAQIVYTDVNPDVSTSAYTLDLNNDGIADFTVSRSYSNTCNTYLCHNICTGCRYRIIRWSVAITPLNGNAIAGTTYPSALNINDSVSQGLNWNTAAGEILRNNTSVGNWSTTNDRYLGLKLIVAGQPYFGWARCSVSSSAFTIRDYAYNSIADQRILAGESGASYITVSAISGSPFCSGGNVIVPFSLSGSFNSSNIVTAELSDASGSFASPVSIGSIVNNSSGSINATIPAGTITGTGYRIRVTTSNPTSVSSPNTSNLMIGTIAAISASGLTNTCGTSVTLSAATSTGNTYQWKLNGNNITYATSYYYGALATGDYTCMVTNSCGSVLSNVISVTVNPLPAAVTVSASPATVVCTGPVSLVSNAGTGLTFEWHNSTGIISGATSSVYDAASSGVYYLKSTNTYGCVRNSNSVSLLIGTPVASVTSSSVSVCHRTPVDLYAYPSGTYYSYQWMKNGVNISGATSQVYSTDQAGTYAVKVTLVSGGCNSTSQNASITRGCRLSLTESSSEMNGDKLFSVAPNPVSGSTKVLFSLDQSENITLKIVDMNGRLIKTFADKVFDEGENVLELDATELEAGIYFLQFQSSENFQTEKLIVTK